MLDRQARDEQDEVLEVDGVGGAEALFVRAEDADGDLVDVRVRRGLVGAAALLLVLVDGAEHGPRRVALLVEAEILEGAGDDGFLVRRVVDDEVRLDADGRAVGSEQLRARRVERAHPERARDRRPAKPLEAGAHLAGRLVREGDGEDAPRRDVLARDEVRDPIGDDARLAAARAREDEERPFGVNDSAGLGLVEVGGGVVQVR